jgi:flagellar hook-basal body complex protein FliE
MSIEAIAAIGSLVPTTPVSAATPTLLDPQVSVANMALPPELASTVTPGQGVFDQLVNAVAKIDAGTASSAGSATELALGKSDNLHHVLIGAERTQLEFELLMSVRNRVLEAYQEIMRMQV